MRKEGRIVNSRFGSRMLINIYKVLGLVFGSGFNRVTFKGGDEGVIW